MRRNTYINMHIFVLQVLFTTSTRDDRVHPGHARKMVRALQEEAKEFAPVVYYWENIEGSIFPVFPFAKWCACCRRRPRRLRLWLSKRCKVFFISLSRSLSRSRSLSLARALSSSLPLARFSCARFLCVGAHLCLRVCVFVLRVCMCPCVHVCMCVCVLRRRTRRGCGQ